MNHNHQRDHQQHHHRLCQQKQHYNHAQHHHNHTSMLIIMPYSIIIVIVCHCHLPHPHHDGLSDVNGKPPHYYNASSKAPLQTFMTVAALYTPSGRHLQRHLHVASILMIWSQALCSLIAGSVSVHPCGHQSTHAFLMLAYDFFMTSTFKVNPFESLGHQECPPSEQPAFFALEYDALECPQADDYCVNAGPECGDSDQMLRHEAGE